MSVFYTHAHDDDGNPIEVAVEYSFYPKDGGVEVEAVECDQVLTKEQELDVIQQCTEAAWAVYNDGRDGL